MSGQPVIYTILVLTDQNGLAMGELLAVESIERGVLFGEQRVDVVKVCKAKQRRSISASESASAWRGKEG